MTEFNARAYAAAPGTGPVGETCKSCLHCWSQRYSKRRIHKCYLLVDGWTFTAATDIRMSSPACSQWAVRRNRNGEG